MVAAGPTKVPVSLINRLVPVMRCADHQADHQEVPMLQLSAFADEISPDIEEQVRVCNENAVTHIELRSVNKINVLDLTREMRTDIKRKLDAGGLGVISIGSPIG